MLTYLHPNKAFPNQGHVTWKLFREKGNPNSSLGTDIKRLDEGKRRRLSGRASCIQLDQTEHECVPGHVLHHS